MLIGIDPPLLHTHARTHTHQLFSPNLHNLLFMHHKQRAHVYLFPPPFTGSNSRWVKTAKRATANKTNQWGKQKQCRSFSRERHSKWKEAALDPHRCMRVIRGSKSTFCDLWPAGINSNDISKKSIIVQLTDVFGRGYRSRCLFLMRWMANYLTDNTRSCWSGSLLWHQRVK